MDIYSWIFVIFIGIIIVGVIAGVIKGLFFNPLPEWVGLTGQAYLDWKKNKQL